MMFLSLLLLLFFLFVVMSMAFLTTEARIAKEEEEEEEEEFFFALRDAKEDEEARLRRSFDITLEFVRAFHDAGGVLVTGSDEVLAPGLSLHEEIRLLTEAGLSNEDALAAATIRAAEVLGVADSLGSIAEGKLADFLILEGDPLEDVANLQLLSRVVKGGVVHDPASLLARLQSDVRGQTMLPGRRELVGIFALLSVAGLTAFGLYRRRRARTSRGL